LTAHLRAQGNSAAQARKNAVQLDVRITGQFGDRLARSISYACRNVFTPSRTKEAQRQQLKPAQKPKP
jgi:hypothetical protein